MGLHTGIDRAPPASPRSLPPPAPGLKPKRYHWTNHEVRIVRETYPHRGLAGCMEILTWRTPAAIYAQANKLGLKAPAESRRGAPRQRWTTNPAMDEQIRRVYQERPNSGAVNDLARRLCRPRWWISQRAERLGIKPPRFKEPPWTLAEDELAARHAHKNPRVIAKIFRAHGWHRTATAIVVRIKRQGWATDDPNHYTANGLAGLMGVDAKTVTRWIEQGWLRAGRRGTERTPQQGGDQWWIRRRDVRAFVADNAAAVDLRKVDKFWFIDLLAGPYERTPS